LTSTLISKPFGGEGLGFAVLVLPSSNHLKLEWPVRIIFPLLCLTTNTFVKGLEFALSREPL
jgi:hypothetical protein